MDKYIKRIKKRMVYQLVGAIALIPVAIYTFVKYLEMDGIISGTPVKDFFGGMFNGMRSAIVAGFVIYLLIMFYYNVRALKKEEKLKEAYVTENDERNIAICEVSSRTTFNITLYVVMAACLISGLFNSVISLTLLATWVFIVLTRFFTMGVYQSKM